MTLRVCPTCHLPYPEADRTHCVVDGTELVVQEHPAVGSLVAGRYRVEAFLGEGGMAEVFRARRAPGGEVVALKLMHPRLSRDVELRERFRREAAHAARLSHPNVVAVLDAGEADGRPYLAMELVEGGTLRDLLDQGVPELPLALALATDVARGLARAHDLGVIHRDVKPENVFVVPGEPRDTAKIGDFGIARAHTESRLTAAGALIGTPAYIAPERIRGQENAPSSDLYALGVLCFELFTGRLPFLSADVLGYLAQHLESPPPSPRSLVPTLPEALDLLVLRLLAKSPSERPVDAHQVVRELTAIAEAVRLPARSRGRTLSRAPSTPPPSATLERWERRVALFREAARGAHPEGLPPEQASLLRALESSVSGIATLRAAQSRHEHELASIAGRTQADRERLGHAVHVLGSDLSVEREHVAKLRAELHQHEAAAADLEGQIAELRTHLGEIEARDALARRGAEQALAASGSEIEALAATAGRASEALSQLLGEDGAVFGLSPPGQTSSEKSAERRS